MTSQTSRSGSLLKIGLLALLLQFALIACGGGDDSSTQTTPATHVAGVGKSIEKVATHTAAQIQAGNRSSGGIQLPESQLLYGANLYRVVYTTTDANGTIIEASGALALPVKSANLPSPLLSFQHGTLFQNAEAPSNDTGPQSAPAILASMGYITVAADYLGYGVSKGTPHPYLQAEPSAIVTHDLLQAIQQWLEQTGTALNQQLFLTGYSEGGYVTLALHRYLESHPIPDLSLTASVAGAGPYHLSATLSNLVSNTNIRQWLRNTANRMDVEIPPAARLPNTIADPLTDYIMSLLIPSNADVAFDDTVVREFLRNGSQAIAKDNVHDWKAEQPIRLFHGRDDSTVPFFNASDTLSAMQARGSADVAVIECNVTPADHDGCIPGYGRFLNEYFHGLATGL